MSGRTEAVYAALKAAMEPVSRVDIAGHPDCEGLELDDISRGLHQLVKTGRARKVGERPSGAPRGRKLTLYEVVNGARPPASEPDLPSSAPSSPRAPRAKTDAPAPAALDETMTGIRREVVGLRRELAGMVKTQRLSALEARAGAAGELPVGPALAVIDGACPVDGDQGTAASAGGQAADACLDAQLLRQAAARDTDTTEALAHVPTPPPPALQLYHASNQSVVVRWTCAHCEGAHHWTWDADNLESGGQPIAMVCDHCGKTSPHRWPDAISPALFAPAAAPAPDDDPICRAIDRLPVGIIQDARPRAARLRRLARRLEHTAPDVAADLHETAAILEARAA